MQVTPLKMIDIEVTAKYMDIHRCIVKESFKTLLNLYKTENYLSMTKENH